MKLSQSSRPLVAVATSFLAFFSSTMAAANPAHENVPANSCEIYLSKILTKPNSHSSAALGVIARVPWLGNGESIQLVGFYGHSQATDLGNSRSCFGSATYNDPQNKVYGADPSSSRTALGEYEFTFPVRSGSVISQCPGYHYTWVGAFFVETNFKTYWLNPDMNPNQSFYFDANGYDSVDRNFGTYAPVSTIRSELKYYNPLSCTR